MPADSFAYGEDGQTLTVTLRDELNLHSGAALTSADVVASLERFRESAGIGAAFKGAVSAITAPDDKTVVFDLPAPSPIIPGLLAGSQAVIMSTASLEGASPTEATRGLDCNGPYTLPKYQPDQGVPMTRLDDY